MGQYWRPEKGWWADGLGQAAPGPWLPTLPSAWLRGGGWWLVTGGRVPGCSLILLRCYLPGEALGTRLPEDVPLQIQLFCTMLLHLFPSYSYILYNYFFQCMVCLSH